MPYEVLRVWLILYATPLTRADREKDELIGTLSNIKRQLTDMQERELQAVQKVKVGIEITEQANMDKTQVFSFPFPRCV